MKRGIAVSLLLVVGACSSSGHDGSLPSGDAGSGPALDGGGIADGGPGPGDGGLGDNDGGPTGDGGPFGDAGVPDAGAERPITPGCPAGEVHGRACVPSGILWLSDAIVSIDGPDCAGAQVHLTTTTDVDGFYRLSGIPAGEVTLSIRKGSFATSATIRVPAGGTLDLTSGDQKICLSRSSARIAVLTGAFDRVERILDQLGLAYTTYSGIDSTVPTGLGLLTDPAELARYDLLLVNCGVNYWSTIHNNPLRWQQIVANLQEFVRSGGSLYASDWAFKAIEDPFPSFIDFNGIDSEAANVNSGFAPQTVTAEVLDVGLRHFLGAETLSISFPNQYPNAMSNNWALMVGVGPETTALLEADVHQCLRIDSCYDEGPLHAKAPLLVWFRPYRSGRVLFTSFHYETVSSETVLALLRYLIFLL
jgi:hypothetical protein